MRRPPRALLLVVGSLAVAGVLGTTACSDDPATAPRAAPSTRGVSASPSSAPVVQDDSCSGGARSAVATARRDGTAIAALPGGSFASRTKAVGTSAIVLGDATYPTADFVAGPDRVDSARVPARSAGIVGAGVDASRVVLTAGSSTRERAVPTTEYKVNPLNVLRVSSAHPVVGGFTLTGTAQGHTYNGLRIERSTGGRIADVKVVAVPGDMNRPPGETFGINDYKTVGSRYEHVEVDGAHVGAAGFGANGSADIALCDVSTHDNRISMGFAFWSVRDIVLTDCVSTRSEYAAFNFERVSGTVRLVRPVAQDARWDMRIASDRGTAKYTIVDPDLTRTKVPGTWTVALPSVYYDSPSLQKRSDITLIVHGEERPDLLRLVKQY